LNHKQQQYRIHAAHQAIIEEVERLTSDSLKQVHQTQNPQREV